MENYQFNQIVNVEKMVKNCLLRKGNSDLSHQNGITVTIRIHPAACKVVKTRKYGMEKLAGYIKTELRI
jgi:hypothetical protein